jgi:DNA-directed RNA polymerase specialized sigma24 family protein
MSAVLEPQSPILPDSTLLDRVVRRDSTALIELERRHWGSLYAQVYSMLVDATLAEWVVRETFTHLWYAAGQFVGTRSASSWLRRRAKELAWAELALRDREYSTSVRRIDEENSAAPGGDVGADVTHGADAGAERSSIG